MDILGLIADIVGVAGAIFALLGWLQARQNGLEQARERERISKKIVLKLQHGGESFELPVELRRSELSRAEILGRIGMLPMKTPGARFALDFISTPDFLRRINRILETDGEDTLTIPCSQEEFDQFKRP